MFASFVYAMLVAVVVVAQATPSPPSPQFNENGTLGTMRPPAGWIQQGVPEFPDVHVTNSFHAPSGQTQLILLGRVDVSAGKSLANIVAEIVAFLSSEDADIVSSQAARLCDGAATGWMIRYRDSGWYIVEAVLMGRLSGTAAIYLRKVNESEDSKALGALNTLCLVPFPK
jgi:hypothetical protein